MNNKYLPENRPEPGSGKTINKDHLNKLEWGQASDPYRMDSDKLFWHRDRLLEWASGKRIVPLHIDMGITTGCNLGCKFCYGVVQSRKGFVGSDGWISTAKTEGNLCPGLRQVFDTLCGLLTIRVAARNIDRFGPELLKLSHIFCGRITRQEDIDGHLGRSSLLLQHRDGARNGPAYSIRPTARNDGPHLSIRDRRNDDTSLGRTRPYPPQPSPCQAESDLHKVGF